MLHFGVLVGSYGPRRWHQTWSQRKVCQSLFDVGDDGAPPKFKKVKHQFLGWRR